MTGAASILLALRFLFRRVNSFRYFGKSAMYLQAGCLPLQSAIMLKDAVAYYHELLSDAELAAASQKLLDEGLESSKLIFGGRRLSPYLRPHFVMESDWLMIKKTGETIFGALQKVKDAAIDDDAILDELGVTEIEKELVKIDPKYSHVSPTSRLDSFLTDDAYSYVELNGESPAGIAFADSASEIFKTLPVMQKFGERYTLHSLEGRSKLLEVLLECYAEFCGGTASHKPVIAIVDLEDLPRSKNSNFSEIFSNQMATNRSSAHLVISNLTAHDSPAKAPRSTSFTNACSSMNICR